ncbi:MFS transporter [Hyphococcus lacteus]|uniref:MFS transporter n=1 Tax=Hyphococcus lacteus TaxID=3143536 RepID=A0ABV3YZX4_9PROT
MKQDTDKPSRGDSPLFFQRRFLPMWTALSFGTFADNTLRQALLIGIPAGVIAVPFFSDSDNAIPFIGALLPIAILIFSSVSGQLADKFETSLMFRRTKFIELLLMTSAAIAFASGTGWLAIAMLFAMGAQSAFFSPVRVSAMPKYLAPDELVRGNGLCNAGLFTFILVGYMVGGSLIVLENGGAMVGVVLISASSIGFFAATRTPWAAANAPELKISFNGFTQTISMFRHVFNSPGVAPPLMGSAVFYFLSTAITVVIPLYGRDALFATPLVWAALNGLFAIGAGLGAITAASMSKNRSGLGASTIAIGCSGLMSFVIYAITPLAAGTPEAPIGLGGLFTQPMGILLTLSLVFTAALSGVYIAPLQAATQRRAPSTFRARIMAAGAFSNAMFAIPGSLSILAVTGLGINPRLAFIALGCVMLLICAVMMYRKKANAEGLYDEVLHAAHKANTNL